MHAPSQETSNTLILDLVSRFLSKILENDPNITHYMKQWSSFQEILSKVPFSLTTAFSHISTVIPLEHAKPSLIRPSPIIEINSIVRNLSYQPTDLNGSFDALQSVPKPDDKVQRRRGNSYGGPQDAPWNREDANKVKPSRFAQHMNSASTNDSATRKMFNILPDDILSGTSVDYSDSGYLSREISGISSTSGYPISSLAARAKKMKDNIAHNTDTLETLQNLNANAAKYGSQYEERSPLRKLKVYEAKDNYSLGLNPISDFGQNNSYLHRVKLF